METVRDNFRRPYYFIAHFYKCTTLIHRLLFNILVLSVHQNVQCILVLLVHHPLSVQVSDLRRTSNVSNSLACFLDCGRKPEPGVNMQTPTQYLLPVRLTHATTPEKYVIDSDLKMASTYKQRLGKSLERKEAESKACWDDSHMAVPD